MNLGYDIAQALPGLRAEAESRMDDLIRTTRAGTKVWDEDSGAWVTAEVVVYEGKARIKRSNELSSDVVPVGSPAFAPNDLIEIAACTSRPDQVGRVFVVSAPFDGSQTTAVRYRVEVADGR